MRIAPLMRKHICISICARDSASENRISSQQLFALCACSENVQSFSQRHFHSTASHISALYTYNIVSHQFHNSCSSISSSIRGKFYFCGKFKVRRCVCCFSLPNSISKRINASRYIVCIIVRVCVCGICDRQNRFFTGPPPVLYPQTAPILFIDFFLKPTHPLYIHRFSPHIAMYILRMHIL